MTDVYKPISPTQVLKRNEALGQKYVYSFTATSVQTNLKISLPNSWFSTPNTTQVVNIRLENLVSEDYTWAGTFPGSVILCRFLNLPKINISSNTGFDYIALIKTQYRGNVYDTNHAAYIDYHSNGIENTSSYSLNQSFDIIVDIRNFTSNSWNFPNGTDIFGTIVFELQN